MSHEVSNLLYLKLIRAPLWMFSLWPWKELYEKRSPFILTLLKPLNVLFHAFMMYSMAYYIYDKRLTVDLLRLVHAYATFVLGISVQTRLLVATFTKSYTQVIANFHNKFHLNLHQHKSEEFIKISSKVNWYAKIFVISHTINAFVSGVFFNLIPMYHNYEAGYFKTNNDTYVSPEFAVYETFPGYEQEDYFVIYWIIGFYQCVICAVVVCTIDMLLIVMIFHIIGHMKVLKRHMEAVPLPQKVVVLNMLIKSSVGRRYDANVEIDLYDKNENKIIEGQLVNIIQHHNEILSFVHLVSESFGFIITVTYGCQLCNCCVLLLECLDGGRDKLMNFGPLTVIIFGQLIELSSAFEFISVAYEDLMHALYNMPWDRMSANNQRTVLFMLVKWQMPLTIKGLGMVPFGLDTMAKVLKLTFSYLTFLRNANN